jgi:hypothetical protein
VRRCLHVCAAFVGALVAACSAGSYTVELRIPTPEVRARVVSVDLWAVESCGDPAVRALTAPVDPLRAVTFRSGERGALGDVRPGRIGLYARAHDAGCDVIAAGCASHRIEAGGSGVLVVVADEIASPPHACRASETCADGTCASADAGGRDGGPDDAAADAPIFADGGCPAGLTVCDELCIDVDTDPRNCGRCASPCTAPVDPGARAVCVDALCRAECLPGLFFSAGVCAPVPAPRPISPLSTATATTRRPVLSWSLATGTDGAHVAICADRACSSVLAELDATGTSAASPIELPPGVVYWRLAGRAGASTGTATSPTWELFVPRLSATRDASWGSVPDLDGDGLAEVIVGAPCEPGTESCDDYGCSTDCGEGRVHVFAGAASGPAATAAVTLARMADNGRFGILLRSIGDVNGDGFPELAVSAPMHDRGRVFVFAGGPTIDPARRTVLSPPAAFREDSFGRAVAGGGDLDGDGYADVVVAAEQNGDDRVYVFFGSATGLPATPSVDHAAPGSNLDFGQGLAMLDADADGAADLLVGSPNANGDLGTLHFYRGGARSLPSTPTMTILAPAGRGDMRLGASVAVAGDVNGDGFPDAIVGGPMSNGNIGRALVYPGGAGGLGSPTELSPMSISGDERFGEIVSGLGDVNGDGYSDVGVAAPTAEGSMGRVYTFTGSAAGVSTTGVLVPRPSSGVSGRMGPTLGGGGDAHGDGRTDVAVGFEQSIVLYAGDASGLSVARSTTLAGADFSSFGTAVVR